jgi:hypothetical protein
MRLHPATHLAETRCIISADVSVMLTEPLGFPDEFLGSNSSGIWRVKVRHVWVNITPMTCTHDLQ